MKKVSLLILGAFLLIIAPKYSAAQNGGQTDSNSVAKIEFLGYTNGKYILIITSNTACSITGVVRINSDQNQKFQVPAIPGYNSDTISFLAPAGANKITFKPDNNSCISGNAGLLEIVSCGPLPVKWGEISARIKKGSLVVNWTTETESLNDYFNIMTSVDGINFEKVAMVQTKATNGISTIPIKYSADIPLSRKVAAGFMAMGFLGLIVIKPKNKKLLILPVWLFLISLSLFFISCQKENVSLKQDNQAQFIKIVQVDKDGNMNSSQIVHIVK